MTDQTPIYAVGDIHGHLASLDRALALIEADGGPDASVVFLGDYVDRGPDVRGVLQRLIDGRDAGRNWRFVLGNHDRMFLRFHGAGTEHDDNIGSGKGWFHSALGGEATLASYGVTGPTLRRVEDVQAEARKMVPAAHIDFLTSLPLWIEDEDRIFVHAGIRPGVPMAEQDEEDLVWIRQGFLEDTTDHGKLVVHGHTALEHPEAYPNRVNLDGGGGFGNPIWPGVFVGRDCWLVKPEGREPLVPA